MHFQRMVSQERIIVCALALIAVAGCSDAPPPPPRIVFDSAPIAIVSPADTLEMTVEVADDESERGYGLMERDSLGPSAGMLFVYDQPQDSLAGFYMYRTRIPLDIAFMDSAGVIVSILTMEPCSIPNPSLCPVYRPGTPYSSALEANRGFFQRNGIAIGAKVVRRAP
jgi:uncharacterized membrane protein (UPF0127 family)